MSDDLLQNKTKYPPLHSVRLSRNPRYSQRTSSLSSKIRHRSSLNSTEINLKNNSSLNPTSTNLISCNSEVACIVIFRSALSAHDQDFHLRVPRKRTNMVSPRKGL